MLDATLVQISSGSLAEELDLPGSDLDVMYLFKDVDVIQDVRFMKHPVQHNYTGYGVRPRSSRIY